MDCETFDSALVDALYDELDEVRMRAMERHAEGCASCAAKLAEMRGTRERAPRSYLLEEPPSGFENRILAAVDEALAKSTKKEEPQSGGAKIFAFVSRPQFAIAAAFVLVLGAALVLSSSTLKKADSVAQSSPATGGEKEEGQGGDGKGTAGRAAPAATASLATLDPAPVPTTATNAPASLAESKKVAGPACAPDELSKRLRRRMPMRSSKRRAASRRRRAAKQRSVVSTARRSGMPAPRTEAARRSKPRAATRAWATSRTRVRAIRCLLATTTSRAKRMTRSTA